MGSRFRSKGRSRLGILLVLQGLSEEEMDDNGLGNFDVEEGRAWL